MASWAALEFHIWRQHHRWLFIEAVHQLVSETIADLPHNLSDDELNRLISGGELGDRKAAIGAETAGRRRKVEEIRVVQWDDCVTGTGILGF
jgi:hypothetical protein